MMDVKWLVIGTGCLALAGVTTLLWHFGFYIAPFAWTNEPARLQQALGIGRGAHVADVGAGDGALAAEIAKAVGETGTVYATELSAESREAIGRRLTEPGAAALRVVEARADRSNLPEECCDAIYLRAVFHHLENQGEFARDLAQKIRDGGRIAIIDFPPGGLWFHGRDHGVAPEAVTAAFSAAGCRLIRTDERWGGGMFLLLFEC